MAELSCPHQHALAARKGSTRCAVVCFRHFGLLWTSLDPTYIPSCKKLALWSLADSSVNKAPRCLNIALFSYSCLICPAGFGGL